MLQYSFKLIMTFFLYESTQMTAKQSGPPKWMADLENDDINLLQGNKSDGVLLLSLFYV